MDLLVGGIAEEYAGRLTAVRADITRCPAATGRNGVAGAPSYVLLKESRPRYCCWSFIPHAQEAQGSRSPLRPMSGGSPPIPEVGLPKHHQPSPGVIGTPLRWVRPVGQLRTAEGLRCRHGSHLYRRSAVQRHVEACSVEPCRHTPRLCAPLPPPRGDGQGSSVPTKIRAIRGPAACSLAQSGPFLLVSGHARRVPPAHEESSRVVLAEEARLLRGTQREAPSPGSCPSGASRRPHPSQQPTCVGTRAPREPQGSAPVTTHPQSAVLASAGPVSLPWASPTPPTAPRGPNRRDDRHPGSISPESHRTSTAGHEGTCSPGAHSPPPRPPVVCRSGRARVRPKECLAPCDRLLLRIPALRRSPGRTWFISTARR
ncbi:hypothetical protein STANM337S_07137 [Streptomyces tanashiensis]